MGYLGRPHAVAAARSRRSHRAPLGVPYGRRLVRDADDLCEGRGDVQRRGGGADGGRPAPIRAAHPSRLHDLPRMFHIWSGAGALAYLVRPYQIVRTPQTRAREPVRS
jgi:hypothetical protein